MIKKLTTIAAALQTITDKQQDLIYKIEVTTGIRLASMQPSPASQPSFLLERPPPLPPVAAIAPTDPPPDLPPPLSLVQTSGPPSAATAPAPPSAATASTPVVPADAADLGFTPMSSTASQPSELLKLPFAPPSAVTMPVLTSAMPALLLAFPPPTLPPPPMTPAAPQAFHQVVPDAFGLCSHVGGTRCTVKEGQRHYSCMFPWDPRGISAHVKFGSYKEYAVHASIWAQHAHQVLAVFF
jgi:hypothetical protein